MSRRWIASILIGIVLITPAVRSTPVKAAQSPLVMTINGDIWTWDGTSLQQRTHYGDNYNPVLSPDGKQIAYLSVASQSVAFNESRTGEQTGLQTGINVYLLNVATNEATRIADQPPDAVFDYNQYGYQKLVIRSIPTWSPDSKSVAWVEALVGSLYLTPPSGSGQLVIYDVATKKTRVLLKDLPLYPYESIYSLPQALWGPSAIALLQQTTMAGTTDQDSTVTVYSLDGKLLSTNSTAGAYDVVDGANWPNFLWAQQNNQFDIAVIIQNYSTSAPDVWQIVDPRRDKSLAPLSGTFQVVSTNNPEGIAVQLHTDGKWYVTEGNSSTPVSTDAGLVGLAISPDGTQLAYATAENGSPVAVYLYAGGGASTLISPNVDWSPRGGSAIAISSISWGPLSWSVPAS